MSDVLPRPLSTIDFVKCAAVVIMVIDHIGGFIFPDQLWWRAIGRFGPIWYFLIGYARSRDIPLLLGAGAGVLLLTSFVAGQPLFPLNALIVIMLIRLTIDRLADFAFKKGENLFLVVLGLVVIFPFSVHIVDNGSVCWLAALLGWCVRHRDQAVGLLTQRGFLPFFVTLVCTVGVISQSLLFPFSLAQGVVMAVGLSASLVIVSFVPLTTYPALTARLSSFWVRCLQFIGHHTLHIYVIHLILLKIGMTLWGQGDLQWFDLRFFAL